MARNSQKTASQPSGTTIEERFEEKTPTSAAVNRRSLKSIPGGTNSLASYYAPYEIAFDRASDAFLWDVDGHRYIDLHNRFTTLIHGHRYAPIVDAINRINSRVGSGPAAPQSDQIDLAELLTDRISSVELVSFCNSGTEAGMLAAQLARRATGRKLILKARVGYHGWYEDLEIGLRFPRRDEHAIADQTLLADYGNSDSFEATIHRHASEIAAVFLEPVLGRGGILSADADFFNRVQKATSSIGALLVADEVISLRLSMGGAQEVVGLNPDLTMMGKLIGGGLPVGAVGGKEGLLAYLDPASGPRMPHYGTFNGNPFTCAAGLISVRELTRARINTMRDQGARLLELLQESARKLGIPFSVSRAGSLLNVFFTERIPESWESWTPNRSARLFHLACLNRGLFIYPRGTMCLSTVMSEDLIKEVGERAAEAMRDVANSN